MLSIKKKPFHNLVLEIGFFKCMITFTYKVLEAFVNF